MQRRNLVNYKRLELNEGDGGLSLGAILLIALCVFVGVYLLKIFLEIDSRNVTKEQAVKDARKDFRKSNYYNNE